MEKNIITKSTCNQVKTTRQHTPITIKIQIMNRNKTDKTSNIIEITTNKYQSDEQTSSLHNKQLSYSLQ